MDAEPEPRPDDSWKNVGYVHQERSAPHEPGVNAVVDTLLTRFGDYAILEPR
jgi:hypothetical protein